MSNQSNFLEISCDAPSYVIVQASKQAGLETPEDVRWCRMSHRDQRRAPRGLLHSPLWKLFWGASGADFSRYCNCGIALPELENYRFIMLREGREICYLLGQCPRCHTVYWEDA